MALGRGRGRARAALRAGAIGATLATLAGCWLQPGYGPEGQRYNPVEATVTAANVSGLAEAWQVDGKPLGQPLVRAGRVLLGATGDDGTGTVTTRLTSLSLRTGEATWDRDVPSPTMAAPVGAGPTVVGDELWIGPVRVAGIDFATDYHRLAPDDGAELGTVTEPWFASVPVAAGSIVADVTRLGFEAEAGSRLTVRDAATTDVRWTAELPDVADGPLISNGPVVADGQIYALTGGGLFAYVQDGCGATTCGPAWSVPFSPAFDRTTSLNAVTDDGHVLYTSTIGSVEGGLPYSRANVVAYTSAGVAAWDTALPPDQPASNFISGVAVAGDTALVVGGDGTAAAPGPGRLGAYATASGDLLWSADLPSFPSPSGVVAVGGDVVYVGVDGAVLAFARDGCGAATCAPLARLPVPGSTRSLAIAQGHLIAASAPSDQPYATTATVTAFALP